MRRVSEEVKSRTLVITAVPCGLMGVACFASLAFGLAFEWRHASDAAMTLLCAIFSWLMLGFSAFTVMELWPSKGD